MKNNWCHYFKVGSQSWYTDELLFRFRKFISFWNVNTLPYSLKAMVFCIIVQMQLGSFRVQDIRKQDNVFIRSEKNKEEMKWV